MSSGGNELKTGRPFLVKQFAYLVHPKLHLGGSGSRNSTLKSAIEKYSITQGKIKGERKLSQKSLTWLHNFITYTLNVQELYKTAFNK